MPAVSFYGNGRCQSSDFSDIVWNIVWKGGRRLPFIVILIGGHVRPASHLDPGGESRKIVYTFDNISLISNEHQGQHWHKMDGKHHIGCV